ncbi:MAG: methionine adenosyltransferase [Tunicatimonas sp.]|uniref:methionine adenosyltransferase n=1 Tax=Tunicatimonas sp. TaxID=1940096 RepID=UPI003C75D04B
MPYLFTSESVSEGHPDKVADQISDAILDAMLTQDPNSRVACETFVTTGLVVVGGEVTTTAYVEIPDIVRRTIHKIGYDKGNYMFDAESCGVVVTLHSQSPDIARGVNEGEDKEQGAGDQGMMFGYANQETSEYMPMALAFSHRLVQELARIRHEQPELIPYLRPDAKAQVTIEYDDNKQPTRVHTVVVSTQHDDFIQPDNDSSQAKSEAEKQMLARIREDVITHVVKKVIPTDLLQDTIYHINPTGNFVIGGPHGDAGLTGRKIIVDTYGGRGAHGGGAFSGKDSSKVDRSAAYAARHIAKNLVAAGIANEVLVQVAYAIGVANPVSLLIDTYGTAQVDKSDAEIAEITRELFDMRPKAIVERFGLKQPIFSPTAAYGHMGREPYEGEVAIEVIEVQQEDNVNRTVNTKINKSVSFFGWEKLDYVDKIKEAFGV